MNHHKVMKAEHGLWKVFFFRGPTVVKFHFTSSNQRVNIFLLKS